MKRQRSAKWPVLFGAVAGLLVWMFDYDFFLNAGGPATPISTAILRALRLQGVAYPLGTLVPMILLVVTGADAGAVIAILLRRLWRPENT